MQIYREIKNLLIGFAVIGSTVFSNSGFTWSAQYTGGPRTNFKKNMYIEEFDIVKNRPIGRNVELVCEVDYQDWRDYFTPGSLETAVCSYTPALGGIIKEDVSQRNISGAHTWMTLVAATELSKRRLFLWKLENSPITIDHKRYESDFEPLKYLNFGNYFADNLWAGRPEGFQKRYPSVLDHFVKNSYNHDLAKTQTIYGTLASDVFLSVRHLSRKPNTFYATGLSADIDGLAIRLWSVVDDQEQHKSDIIGLDNLFHFSNAETAFFSDDKDTQKVRIYRTHSILNGQSIFVSSDVGANLYGDVLYSIGRKFWKSNLTLESPTTDDFEKAGPGASISTGKLRVGFNNDGVGGSQASLPHTYLGGNPYICVDNNEKPFLEDCSSGYKGHLEKPCNVDLCENGIPTWPVWVPEKWSSDADFRNQLKTFRQTKQNRTALIYLGWAAHLLQDLANPWHAINRHGTNHGAIESWLDRNKEVFDNGKLQQKINALFGTAQNPKSRAQVCGDTDPWEITDQLQRRQASRLIQISDEYDSLPRYISSSSEAPYMEEAAHDGILGTMKILACFGEQNHHEIAVYSAILL